MTTKQRLKAIQKACEQAEAAHARLHPARGENMRLADCLADLAFVAKRLRREYATLSEEATDGPE